MKPSIFLTCAIVIGCLFAAMPARAETTGVKGYVTMWVGERMAPLEGALVQLRSRNQSFDAHTDRHGFFSFIGLLPEKQVQLRFSREGLGPKVRQRSICVNTMLEVDVTLASRVNITYFFEGPQAEPIDFAHFATQYSVDPEADLGTQGSAGC